MKYLLYFLGFLPSVVWLLFYLRKDKNPEPNSMVLKIFFFGMLAALGAIFLEKGFQVGYGLFSASPVASSLIGIFLGGALIEEYAKYFVVRLGVFRHKELDEPTDLVIYMIISALGFAALENILVLSNYHPILTPATALEVMGLRFVSATFLHALCSGIWGYFLALSFCKINRRKIYVLAGLATSVFLHGLYNYSIMKMDSSGKLIVPLLILIILSCFVSYSFKKLKKLKSVCHFSKN